MKQKNKVIIFSRISVWAAKGIPPQSEGLTVLWNSFGLYNQSNNIISIPKIVEDNANKFKLRYLTWIYDIGNKRIRCKHLLEHLHLRPSFSYWWMTSLVYKPNAFSSPQIADAVKMLAFEELMHEYSTNTIILVNGDNTLAKIFKIFCKNYALDFERINVKKNPCKVSHAKKMFLKLPHILQAFIWLVRYIFNRWPLKNVVLNTIPPVNTSVTFCSYLLNLDTNALNQSRLVTSYWSALQKILEKEGVYATWIHKYIKHDILPSAVRVRKQLSKINLKNQTDNQFHITMESALGYSVIIGALRDYSRIVKKSLKLRKIRTLFQPKDSKIDFWPLFKKDWQESIYGYLAIKNCLDINLAEKLLQDLPHQRAGFYLQENQPWEMAFIHFWKSRGHGTLIGVPHSTVRFWDLRYFFDKRTYRRTDKYNLPLPDKVAVNGQVAFAAYKQGGYPTDKIIEVEALRYLYLEDMPRIHKDSNHCLSSPLHVLVLGDYDKTMTCLQLEWLKDASHLLPSDIRFTVKPHPNCPVDIGAFQSLKLQITNDSLSEILCKCDIAYTSNITSAAVDAFCAGMPVISMLNGDTLNMSPLRGMVKVTYVTSPQDLAQAIKNPPKNQLSCQPYFYLNKEIPRWRKLLAETNKNQ